MVDPADGVPTLDYTATVVRPDWDDLPPAVRAEIGRAAGSPVVRAQAPPGSGFTGGFAAVVELADGRTVFAKAGSSVNPHLVAAYAQEATVLQALPDAVPAPRYVGHGRVSTPGTPENPERTDWQVLVTEAVRGRLPQPWTERDLSLVHDACVLSAGALTPAPPGLDLPSLAVTFGQDQAVLTTFADLHDGGLALTSGQPGWLPRRYQALQNLVESAATLLVGSTACHGDLRADNVLIVGDGLAPGRARALLVDWNWLMVGPAWTDVVGVLPLARADGLDADGWLRRSPLTRQADPRAIDCFLAVIAAYMLRSADDPVWPGGSHLIRVHQRRYARTFLDWLAARNGWE